MTVNAFRILTSRTVVLTQSDIDTDQIIPARFLTTTSREGLGKSAFYDWRYDESGRPRNSSALNGVNTATHKILVAGSNFACGSSREHAPWALLDFGFRVVISTDIADIFTSNALKNGLLPIEVPAGVHDRLIKSPGVELTIDLEANQLLFDGESVDFSVEPFARRCLLDGVDPLGFLLSQETAIVAYESAGQEAST